jgi:predicted amidohydrolase
MLQKLSLVMVLLLTTSWLACTILHKNQETITDKIPLKVATVCMNAVTDKQANLHKFFSYMMEAASQKAKLIVFPEAALQQNPAWNLFDQPTQEELDYIYQSAETIPGESTKKLIKKAKKLNIYVMFGMTEKVSNGDVLYNSCVLLGPDGIIGKHRKRYVWKAAYEYVYWMPSNELGIIDSPFGKIGIMICGNMFYNSPDSPGGPVTGPFLVKVGADFLVSISAWPAYAGGVYNDAAKRNASETKCWHVSSNQVGSVGHTTSHGHSKVIDPDGNTIVDTGPTEGIVIAETDILIDIANHR